MRIKLVNAALLVVGLVLAADARADLVIKITQGVNQPTPIAVVPFGWGGSGASPLDVARVVRDDLARSGLFAPLPPAKMLARPTTAKAVHFVNWKAVRVNDLVIGSVTPTPSGYNVRFRLYNVYTGRQLLGYVLPSAPDALRFTAHVVSDMIYKQLTGIPGAFATRIAYIKRVTAGKGTRWELVVADADGANARVVVKSPGLLMSPTWSPNGRELAYVEFASSRSHIYIQNIATGQRRLVFARPGLNSAPRFSPDGKRLAVVLSSSPGNPDIYILDLASGKLIRVTHSPAIDTEPAWMPNGKAIVFTSGRGGSPQVYEKNLDTGSVQRLTWQGGYNARPVVSPSGKKIAFVHRENGALHIALINLASGNMRLLTNGPADVSPSFSPNGAMILYSTVMGRRQMLATVSVDGQVRQELFGTAGTLVQPVWGPFPPHLAHAEQVSTPTP